MDKFVTEYISQYEQYIKEQVKYVSDNPWQKKRNRTTLLDEEGIHLNLAKSTLVKLEHFLSNVEREDRHKYKTIQKFVELLATAPQVYIENCEDYLNKHKGWVNEKDAAKKAAEIIFQDELLSNMLNLNKKLQKLNIDNTMEAVSIPIHSDKLIPFMMRDVMEKKYPEILEYVNDRDK